jgi:glycosyltransferase involved in cell wall biosynthesis
MKNANSGHTYKFLLICHSYPPVIGGSELEAQRVCEALMHRGHRVTVVCAGGKPMPPVKNWVDPKGVPVRIYARHWNGIFKNVVFALRVGCMLIWERRNYQLVYFLMQGLHLAIGLPIARLLGKPVVMKIAGSGEVPRMQKSIAGRFELRMLQHWARRVMILNEGMRQEAIAHGFAPEQLLWMPNPVDVNQFAPPSNCVRQELRRRFGIPDTGLVVLYCGRLAPEKALPSLLDAFSLVVRELEEAFLVLVGDGPLRCALEEQAKQLKLTDRNLRFAGSVDPDDVSLWLKVGDAFALVSFSEGFPCSLIEAMSVGLPSVASDIPANQQLIANGKQGFLVPAGDSKTIAAALIYLLKNSDVRSRMGHAARQAMLESYSTSKVVERYENLLRQTLEESSSCRILSAL